MKCFRLELTIVVAAIAASATFAARLRQSERACLGQGGRYGPVVVGRVVNGLAAPVLLSSDLEG